MYIKIPPEVLINHIKLEIKASFKKEARFFFEVKRRVSYCGFQNNLEGMNCCVIQSHPR